MIKRVVISFAFAFSVLSSLTSVSTGVDFSTWASRTSHGAFSRAQVRAPLYETAQYIQFPKFIDLTMKNFAFQAKKVDQDANVWRIVDGSGEWFDVHVIGRRSLREKCTAFHIVDASEGRFPYSPRSMKVMFYACARPAKRSRFFAYRQGSTIDFFSRLNMENEPHKIDKIDVTIMNNMLGSILASWAENAERQLRPSDCSRQFRSITGHCNNIRNPSWGASKHALRRQRSYDPDYASSEGKISSRYNHTASARAISLIVASQDKPKTEPNGLTDLFTIWGQLVDHDITIVEAGHGGALERLDIEVDRESDPVFNQTSLSLGHLNVERSSYERASRDGHFQMVRPRNQINHLTGFVDASFVYGSSIQRAAALRNFKNGEMMMSVDGTFLPKNQPRRLQAVLENAGGNSSELYAAGDVRSNENPILTFLHLVMLKEHNRICKMIKKAFPRFSDQSLYDYARQAVIAQVQAITFEQWLPYLLGSKQLPKYKGYNANTDPSISAYFQTFAFRFGHSMINMKVARKDCRKNQTLPSIPLSRTLFNPAMKSEVSPESILCGAAYQRAQQVDAQIVSELQNILFSVSKFALGVDLFAFNVQRLRDHGIPPYNTVRRSLDLSPKESIVDIAQSSSATAKLTKAYSGKLEDIDAFSGALSEDKVYDSPLGETLHLIIRDQFLRLRDGDRFYFRRKPFPSYMKRKVPELARIEKGRFNLGDIIAKNTDLKRSDLPHDVFRL